MLNILTFVCEYSTIIFEYLSQSVGFHVRSQSCSAPCIEVANGTDEYHSYWLSNLEVGFLGVFGDDCDKFGDEL